MTITIDPVKKAEIDREVALANLDYWFQNTLDGGFTTSYGWRLGLSESDVTLLTGQFVLAKEADAAELPIPAVVDKDGVPHQLETIEELTGLMLSYGAARSALSAEYATRKAAIMENQE
jgi:hypothetical protein